MKKPRQRKLAGASDSPVPNCQSLQEKKPTRAGPEETKAGRRWRRPGLFVIQVFWMATPEPVVMSTPRVSRRNSAPMMTVITATMIGYHSPA